MGCEDHSIAQSAIAQSGSPSKPVKRIIFLHNSKRHRNLIIVNKWLICGKLTVKRHHVRIVFRWKKTAINWDFIAVFCPVLRASMPAMRRKIRWVRRQKHIFGM
jgi:hypothetical protein